jgi:hypothetical protein
MGAPAITVLGVGKEHGFAVAPIALILVVFPICMNDLKRYVSH